MKEKGKSFVNEHDVLHEVKQELTDYEEDLGRHCKQQYCGSMTFWYGSASADPCL
jgi:hypothetical protein